MERDEPGRPAGACLEREADGAGHVTRLPWWVWLSGVLVAVLVMVYVGAVVVDDLPPSPARQALLPAADRVVNPWFAQQWTLFAPTPPLSNARFYLMVRYRAGSSLPRPPAVDLSAVFQRMAEARRWAPPRLYRVTMDLAVEIDRTVLYANRRTPAGAVAGAQSEADVYFAPSSLGAAPPLTPTQARLLGLSVAVELQRLLSASASQLMPHPRRLAAVRAVETATPIPPFTARQRHERPIALFDTGWMPYVPTVAS